MTNEIDVNAITSQDATNAGMYMMYNILVAVGGLASLLVLAIIMGVILAKFGLGKILKF